MKLLPVISLLALFALSEAGVSMNNPFYCYSTDWVRSTNQMHSVRSSYEAIRRTEVDPAVSSCTPSRFWFLGRHGGRLPETEILIDMFAFADSSLQADILRNWESGRTTLCLQDILKIQSWVRNPNVTFEHEAATTVAGWTAMQNIGRRYQQFFPTLLPQVYNSNWYLFRNSHTRRSFASIRGFVDGLFGDNSWPSVTFENVPDFDSFMRPIDFCPAFTEATRNSNDIRNAFAEGPEVQQMLEEVNRRLGFTGARSLNFHTIWVMWEWCRFETASEFELSSSPIGEPSTWCAPFTPAHHAILEYYADLGYYYFTGYGVQPRRLIENLNCGLAQDMIQHLQAPAVAQPIARVFVTDSQMVQSFLVTLGARFDPVTLNQFNFAQQTFRQWRTSFVTPNAANIAIVRYDCPGGDNDVLFLLNEQPLQIPGCQANGLCKVNFIVQRLQRFINPICELFFCTTE